MVSEPKINLELLFTRGIIKIEEFWGGAAGPGAASGLEKLIRLMKLLDRPRFIRRLVTAMKTGAELKEHYMNFPENYDPAAFTAWVNKKQALFARIPPAMIPPR